MAPSRVAIFCASVVDRRRPGGDDARLGGEDERRNFLADLEVLRAVVHDAGRLGLSGMVTINGVGR